MTTLHAWPSAAQLIALAKDQVEKCATSCIEADVWNCSVPAAKREKLVLELCSGQPTLKLLYTTPGEQTRDPIELSFSYICNSLHVQSAYQP